MTKAELIKQTLEFLNMTGKTVGKLVDFYIDYALNDENVKLSLLHLIEGYVVAYPHFPEIITGNLDGRNLKKEIMNSLEEVQIALHLSREDPEELRLKWQEFYNYQNYYSVVLSELIDNQRFIYLNMN
ncbi:MAG: hypothetical protein KIT33_05170 [Candidatus Kapabacteria bacterium]|nr:hypothetical protein [Ignavibacteriota bacterium]MCW5884347.1 hypothetical protein [Candidatus Kapabacteria bacterium]